MEDNVITVRHTKNIIAELMNQEVVCIEIGGSGQSHLNNWDHHEFGGPQKSATYQVWEYLERPKRVERLVEYIDIIDTRGPRFLPHDGKVKFPTLCDVFSGMFLIKHNQAK